VVARSATANQAFVSGRTLGVQFHPEVDEAVLDAWLSVGDPAELTEAGIDPAPLIEQARVLADGAAARAHGLVRRFVRDVARRPAVALPALATADGARR
jgi:GMP synthase-like glutamine amidotransferase